jgi:hypothetical protein
MPDEDWSQAISCRDALGRSRQVVIRLGAENGIVFVAPPGEIAHLTPDESMFVRSALEEAEGKRPRAVT